MWLMWLMFEGAKRQPPAASRRKNRDKGLEDRSAGLLARNFYYV